MRFAINIHVMFCGACLCLDRVVTSHNHTMQCQLCIVKKGTRVWKDSWYADRVLTCDDCAPENKRYMRYKIEPCFDFEIKEIMDYNSGNEEYAWACTGMQDPVAHSFKCFDCHKIAPGVNGPGTLGRLDHMGLYMKGNVKMPLEFQFPKHKGQFMTSEFIVCEQCGQRRHAERRDSRTRVTDDVAKYYVNVMWPNVINTAAALSEAMLPRKFVDALHKRVQLMIFGPHM